MPLLRNGHLVNDDVWTHLADDDDLSTTPVDHPIMTSLARYLAEVEDGTPGVIAGVQLEPADDATLLEPHVDRLQLISIHFPVYTDGRGYSQARLLKGRLGFAGELRAIGDVRPDQILFMMRAGIDTLDLPDPVEEATVQRLLSRFRSNYQPTYALPIAG